MILYTNTNILASVNELNIYIIKQKQIIYAKNMSFFN